MTWLPVVISGLLLGLNALTFWATRREKKYDLFLSLWKQYGSRETLDALRAVYNLWTENEGKTEKIVKEYIRRFHKKDDSLHYQRRTVSFLYQMLAFLYFHNLIPKEFRKEWLGFNLGAIAVLHPIETIAMKKILNKQAKFPDLLDMKGIESIDFRRMFELYNTAGRRKKKDPLVELDELIRLQLLARSSVPYGIK